MRTTRAETGLSWRFWDSDARYLKSLLNQVCLRSLVEYLHWERDGPKQQKRFTAWEREQKYEFYATQMYESLCDSPFTADPMAWSSQKYALLIDRAQPETPDDYWMNYNGRAVISSSRLHWRSSRSSSCGWRGQQRMAMVSANMRAAPRGLPLLAAICF